MFCISIKNILNYLTDIEYFIPCGCLLLSLKSIGDEQNVYIELNVCISNIISYVNLLTRDLYICECCNIVNTNRSGIAGFVRCPPWGGSNGRSGTGGTSKP